ncbi:YheC/YheD family protein [Bacillus carboniphilus]|uniref:YheC/YheD family protein n=1 Tax=Bacillus carboniphilus TaxID=86663 RepID=A0ABY9JUQ5_9BACI|nr:YheC/YheD family protein [Bacillus carboniphilus]WLR43129.1 YheC/YheD family protein [Bacillus carboniphilus]
MTLSKWDQYQLLLSDQSLHPHIPKTTIYDLSTLIYFSRRFRYIYVKHNTSGQGRGIFKIEKTSEDHIIVNGYPTLGKEQLVFTIHSLEDFYRFHTILYPQYKLNHFPTYIIQEGIQSLKNVPFSIRVHVQKMNDDWTISGMYGKVAKGETVENGIVNTHKGADVYSIDSLLTHLLQMDTQASFTTIKTIETLSILTSKIMSRVSSKKEFGIDLGINKKKTIKIFEVNEVPGVGPFSLLPDKSIYKRILANRKIMKEQAVHHDKSKN